MDPAAAVAIAAVGCYRPTQDPPVVAVGDLVASATAGRIESRPTATCGSLKPPARWSSSVLPATPVSAG